MLSEPVDGVGFALDDEASSAIPLVGFGDDGDFGEIAFVGFDDEPASPPARTSRASAKRSTRAGMLRGLGEGLRRAGSFALSAVSRIRFWLTGTQLRARRTRTALVVLAALVLSVGAGVLVRGWLPSRQAIKTALEALPVALPAPQKSVLVARQAIPRGRIIRAADIGWQPWPAESIQDRYIELGARTIADLTGEVAIEPIAQGEPVDRGKLRAPGERGFMSAVLHPGMRAVSVGIKPETAVAGLIQPGDRIDVVLTVPVLAADRRDPNDTDNRYGVETVLSNLRVLAIDQALDGKPGEALLGETATVETTPKQAEILTLSEYLSDYYNSKLSLSLNSLAPGEADAAAGRSTMVDADISKLLPRRDTVASRAAGNLTIVRRSVASDANGS